MSEFLKLSEWIEKYKSGYFNNPSIDVQIDAGWLDWFCKDSSLRRKTLALGRKVLSLSKSPKINKDTTYVLFKNNWPVSGKLYDDIRFVDAEIEEVIYTVIPHCGHTNRKGISEVWGRENEFKEPLVSGTWKDVKKFFGVGR